MMASKDQISDDRYLFPRSFPVCPPHMLQLTTHTGFSSNFAPNRCGPNPSQCRDARRRAV